MARIVRVEMARFDYPVRGRFKFLPPGPDGVVRRPSVLVRLTDADGVQGWGQAVPIPTWSDESPETVEVSLRHRLAPALLGMDPEDLEAIHARLNAVVRPSFSVGQPIAKAAVDLACWDLAGRRAGRRVADLLGGVRRERLSLSWTVATADPDEAEAQVAEGKARGYRHFNIKVGPPQSPQQDVALARRVREAAPEGFLWADANTGYSPGEAAVMARRLADAGVDVLESPLPPNRLRDWQALKRLGALPIVMDEGILSPVEAEEFFAMGMMDGVVLKPARNAGLWPSRELVLRMRSRGALLLGSGLTDPDLSLAASLHLFAWADLDRPCALNGPQFLADPLARPPLTPRDGELLLPPGPGLGVEPAAQRLHFEVVAEAARF